MTMGELALTTRGYYERLKVQRLHMFLMVRLWGDPKSGPKRPEDFWPLPFDQENNGRLTDEQIKDILKSVHAGRAKD